MALTPEEQARKAIDEALHQAGWDVQDVRQVNVNAAQGVAIREFPLQAGYGTADYLLYVNGKAAGALEAKPSATDASPPKRRAVVGATDGRDKSGDLVA